MHSGPNRLGRSVEGVRQAVANRIGKTDMRHHPVAKKSILTNPLCPVDELVRDHNVTGGDRLLQASDGGNGDNSLHAQLLHAVDIGPVVNL